MAVGQASARRADWTRELFELAIDQRKPNLAVFIIAQEWRALGRSIGWRNAGEWFETFYRNDPAIQHERQWLAIQSLIWFGRAV